MSCGVKFFPVFDFRGREIKKIVFFDPTIIFYGEDWKNKKSQQKEW